MHTKTHPFLSRIKERYRLTGPGSSKKTYHVVLDIKGADLPFKVGDSVGVAPSNDPKEVHHIINHLRAKPTHPIFDPRSKETLPLETFLLYRANLSRGNRALLEALIEKGAPLSHLLEQENQRELTHFLQSHSLLELLKIHRLSPEEIAKNAMPLMPRFYSIANSSKVFPEEIHLLVAYVEYELNGEIRKGIGSHFLCDVAQVQSTPIPIYVQPSNHFTLPQSPDTSIILIGPGTGIAPYRAFLQERLASQASGRNWIFFGERNRASDFYYSDFWLDLEAQGRARLSLAFSRDGKEKTYVQHRMYEERKSLWNWIEQGAHLFVCGDASQMAKDVEATLLQIVKEEGNLAEEDARAYLKKMRTEKRYLADVY